MVHRRCDNEIRVLSACLAESYQDGHNGTNEQQPCGQKGCESLTCEGWWLACRSYTSDKKGKSWLGPSLCLPTSLCTPQSRGNLQQVSKMCILLSSFSCMCACGAGIELALCMPGHTLPLSYTHGTKSCILEMFPIVFLCFPRFHLKW